MKANCGYDKLWLCYIAILVKKGGREKGEMKKQNWRTSQSISRVNSFSLFIKSHALVVFRGRISDPSLYSLFHGNKMFVFHKNKK